jgi:hypothetical protein
MPARALGKRPAIEDPRVPKLRRLAAQPEQPPDNVNWWADVGEWPMLRNDTIGDCVPAAALHQIQQRRAYAGRPIEMTDVDAEALYVFWGGWKPDVPASDQGCVMSTALLDWVRDGIALPDGSTDKPEAVAAIDHASLLWLRYAIWKFGGAMIGMRFPTDWFDAGYLLDLPDDAEPAIAGGHCMLVVGCELTALGFEFDVITWGQRMRMTWRAAARVLDEAYAILNRDWLDVGGHDPAGLDWQAAQAAMAELTRIA